MANDNRTCVICGTNYKYCGSCPSKYNPQETWRNIFCSENCRELYHIYDDIKSGKKTEKEASKLLKKLDLSHLDTFKEPMKSVFMVACNLTEKTDSNETENKSTKIRSRSKVVKK